MRVLGFSLIGAIILSLYFIKDSYTEKVKELPFREEATPAETQNSSPDQLETKMSREIAAATLSDIKANIVSQENTDAEIDLNRADDEVVVSQCQSGNWQACKKLHISCQQRNYGDCFTLARKLSESSQKRAIPYYKLACEQNSHMESCLNLALARLEFEEPSEEILRYLHKACVDGGISMACLEMAENDPDPERRDHYKSYAQKLAASSRNL